MNLQTAIRTDKAEQLRLAREEAYATPLKDFHPGAPRLFQNDTLWPWFERLRKEIQRHHGGRHQSRHLLLRRSPWRHRDSRCAGGL
jgi:hypothetical protein